LGELKTGEGLVGECGGIWKVWMKWMIVEKNNGEYEGDPRGMG
jgi:hypothetical protein